ncbi:hypothetical protein [Galbibacter sp. BG1]|uniref:hypothetical protein n=1 Tax=Galbibacter sp. BG1 TaxID=1170699 RepID=UPI001C706636|nr:hypothetical protein [Galbibacter sp. BG1]
MREDRSTSLVDQRETPHHLLETNNGISPYGRYDRRTDITVLLSCSFANSKIYE